MSSPWLVDDVWARASWENLVHVRLLGPVWRIRSLRTLWWLWCKAAKRCRARLVREVGAQGDPSHRRCGMPSNRKWVIGSNFGWWKTKVSFENGRLQRIDHWLLATHEVVMKIRWHMMLRKKDLAKSHWNQQTVPFLNSWDCEDKLKKLEVDVGNGEILKIVTNASNVKDREGCWQGGVAASASVWFQSGNAEIIKQWLQITTVDGSEIWLTRWYGKYPITWFYTFQNHPNGGWPWDFWTINAWIGGKSRMEVAWWLPR